MRTPRRAPPGKTTPSSPPGRMSSGAFEHAPATRSAPITIAVQGKSMRTIENPPSRSHPRETRRYQPRDRLENPQAQTGDSIQRWPPEIPKNQDLRDPDQGENGRLLKSESQGQKKTGNPALTSPHGKAHQKPAMAKPSMAYPGLDSTNGKPRPTNPSTRDQRCQRAGKLPGSKMSPCREPKRIRKAKDARFERSLPSTSSNPPG